MKKAKLDKTPIQDVTIQVGLMVSKDGELKIKRGSNLPIKVSPMIGPKELKSKAVEKHSRFNQPTSLLLEFRVLQFLLQRQYLCFLLFFLGLNLAISF